MSDGLPLGNIYYGTSSWTDKTLLQSKAFYPPSARSAEDRLRFYAEHFPLVEVDATYYALPSEDNALRWAERTPAHFVFNVKAFGLFTQHAIARKALPPAIRAQLGEGPDRLQPKDFPDELGQLVWEMFVSALRPLADAGKLGAVLFQFPYWFRKNRANVDHLRQLAKRLPYRAAIEFRGGGWMDEGRQQSTLSLLEELGLSYVAVDEPQGFASSIPPVVASTSSELAMIRFHGQNTDTWEKRGLTPAERFRYLYSEDELREWVAPARELAGGAKQLHLLMNNCYADYGVRNAGQLASLLAQSP